MPDDIIEAFKRDVDKTLLRENLRRSPSERLQAMTSMMDLVEELRRAARARLASTSAALGPKAP